VLVSVNSTSNVTIGTATGDSPFDFFFRGRPGGDDRSQQRQGIGSGVIVDGKGDVLTNNHVVADADQLKVVLSDNREFAAKVVGTDPKTDLAVIKVDTGGEELPAAMLGSSDTLQVGEWVIAAGSPFGLRQTVSAGIVSAVGRGNVGISEYEDFIQTDAAINPGNSGGPLVDLTGRVVGINTAIASSSGANSGVGFAIPIAMARTVMGQLLEHGKVTRGYLGIAIAELTPELARSFGYNGNAGVLVQDVTPGAPAARAGLEPGDIILGRDGKPVSSAAAFRNAVAETQPGRTIELEVWRDAKRHTVRAKLDELPTGGDSERQNPRQTAPSRYGVRLSDLTPELQERLNAKANEGAVVVQVEPGSPAEGAGLKPGDVIVQVGKQPVGDAASARRALQNASAHPLRLRIMREGRGQFVVLPKPH
jgi:serine protease Do